MRILSTDESIAKNEPSVLALVETIVAMTISAGIAVWYDTLAHVAVSCCIAPLLLMRSPESKALGTRWFNKFELLEADELLEAESSASSSQWRRVLSKIPTNPFANGWQFLKALIQSVAIKFLVTARYPIRGTQQIPANWARVVLCTDIATSVELVPGTGSVYDILRTRVRGDDPDFTGLLIQATLAAVLVIGIHFWIRPLFENIAWQILFWYLEITYAVFGSIFTLGLSCYLVAYLYRLSLKSTALVWLPLVYVVQTAFDKTVPVAVQLEEIRESGLWKLTRMLAWLTLALLALKIVILPTVIDWWNSQPWTRVLNVYVMPNEIHPWHIATGLNAVITLLGFYYFLDRAPRRIREGVWNGSTILNAVQAFTLTRGIISIYTIIVGLYLTVIAARSMNWPLWSGRLFPW